MNSDILIVDDATFIREVLKQTLNKEGLRVVDEAENGEEAIEKYISYKPALVLMDMVMPKMNGILATEEIKKIDPSAKIIALSTEDSEDLVCKALEAGCLNYISKPFKIDELISIINKTLEC